MPDASHPNNASAHDTSHFGHPIVVDRDQEHLRLLVIYHGVVAGLSLLGLLLFVILPLVLGSSYQEILIHLLKLPQAISTGAALQKRLLLGLLAGSMMIAVLALNGWSMSQRKNYYSCLILSCVECLSFPLGMILGVSAILVLRRDSVKAMFRQ